MVTGIHSHFEICLIVRIFYGPVGDPALSKDSPQMKFVIFDHLSEKT